MISPVGTTRMHIIDDTYHSSAIRAAHMPIDAAMIEQNCIPFELDLSPGISADSEPSMPGMDPTPSEALP
jgi:hypothetical protein